MGDFSISPTQSLADNLAKGYIGVHLQQGVPLRDEDLNLLGDLVLAAARLVAAGYIGSGIAAGREGFEIRGDSLNNDLDIRAGSGAAAGSCLVNGVEVVISAPIRYASQHDVAPLTAPTAAQPDPRTDIAYLDVWLADVESDEDPDLDNPGDVGVQTSTRIRPAWRVRVAEGADITDRALPMPVPAAGHSHHPLARLTRPRGQTQITAEMVTDLRQRNLTMSDIEGRVRSLEQAVLLPRFEDAPGQNRPFAPPLGAPGTVVHIFGHNLRVGAPAVLFGTQPAAAVNPLSDSEITATVPAMAPDQVTLTVITGGGRIVTDDTFNVLPAAAGAPPVLAAPPGEFSPPLGAAGTAVQIAGTHFDGPNLAVSFGATVATVTASTATSITTTVPAGAPAGGVKLTVSTQFGTDTSINNFTVL